MNVNVWDVNEHDPGADPRPGDGRPRRALADPDVPLDEASSLPAAG